MKVLGVSYGYHDSSACLVVDGRVVAASAEERFTRQKHDANFPMHAIEFVLSRAKLRPADVDHVVFHEDPHVKFARVLATVLAPFPGSR
jgi:carbamoyltransferase